VPSDRYGKDVLAPGTPARSRVATVVGERGLVVECAASGWCGSIVGWHKGADGWAVVLEDRHGRSRPFAATGSFLIDGDLVSLSRPMNPVAASSAVTASGSVAAPSSRARIAVASRIWVEGRQDAELIEKVWGDDLRDVGVIVEELGGADVLQQRLREFVPSEQRRVGVLLDHLVAGSKESRIAALALEEWPDSCLVVGHPFIDVWQSVRPAVLGIDAWPVVPFGTDWKTGVCAELGWSADTGVSWRAILARVRTFADLEPELLGRVEELIDFVAEEP
jgi:hypothetical protein